MDLHLRSNDFNENETIPRRFTCDAENLSPSLTWSGAPGETRQFTLIVDDPDAPRGTWVHWVVYAIPANVTSLPEGVTKMAFIEDVGKQGINDFQEIGYDGPCPPPGPAHRYFFKLYALDTEIDLPLGATKAEVEEAMRDHILSSTQLVGYYSR
ncbi:MAG: YbhB/YbcL family Raf kinase inhibitor-like protein [Anaerolineales bacterium]|nr:YbhB/YbcL family Raf kinase inhibitor-like protein [Anaerolineales bacterium]